MLHPRHDTGASSQTAVTTLERVPTLLSHTLRARPTAAAHLGLSASTASTSAASGSASAAAMSVGAGTMGSGAGSAAAGP